jgi:hypothetical protein
MYLYLHIETVPSSKTSGDILFGTSGTLNGFGEKFKKFREFETFG